MGEEEVTRVGAAADLQTEGELPPIPAGPEVVCVHGNDDISRAMSTIVAPFAPISGLADTSALLDATKVQLEAAASAMTAMRSSAARHLKAPSKGEQILEEVSDADDAARIATAVENDGIASGRAPEPKPAPDTGASETDAVIAGSKVEAPPVDAVQDSAPPLAMIEPSAGRREDPQIDTLSDVAVVMPEPPAAAHAGLEPLADRPPAAIPVHVAALAAALKIAEEAAGRPAGMGSPRSREALAPESTPADAPGGTVRPVPDPAVEPPAVERATVERPVVQRPAVLSSASYPTTLGPGRLPESAVRIGVARPYRPPPAGGLAPAGKNDRSTDGLTGFSVSTGAASNATASPGEVPPRSAVASGPPAPPLAAAAPPLTIDRRVASVSRPPVHAAPAAIPQSPTAWPQVDRPPAVGVARNLRSAIRRIVLGGLRLAILTVLAVCLLWAAALLAYRFIDPPASTLMIGQYLTGRTIEKRWTPIERISPNLIRAVIASEDGNFCRHRGVDWSAIDEALDKAAEDGGRPRGASTISMQTVKNLMLWPQAHYIRKILELPLAYLAELSWGKKRMLELYLNNAEWGPGIFGAEAAALYHFRKSAASLTLREAALLAVALPNPIERNPGAPGPGMQRLGKLIEVRAARPTLAVGCLRLNPR